MADIVHEEQATMRLAGDMLGRDLAKLGGMPPASGTSLAECRQRCVVIGTADSALVREAARLLRTDLTVLKGAQERYLRVAGDVPGQGRQILLLAGADPRGAIYGVSDLVRELGVSPWEWWADVTPPRKEKLTVDSAVTLSKAPSVAFRGIFLNDEREGLGPWASKTFDPSKNIGPRTYARVFELMWRLKANLIWPAMHPGTAPLFSHKENIQLTKDYAIVIGSSHAEAMLRNNVGEWNPKRDGEFNFLTNRDTILRYWNERVRQSVGVESIYTVGMRGVHDTGMEGVSNPTEGRDVLARVLEAQRDILGRAHRKAPDRIPQALTLYKEVLDVYNQGLKVPDDITLVWPDDNYGYLHQLGTPKERSRTGGSGIYYHLSYWGRPHPYIWLGTTHPALVRDQLQRAWHTGARRIWVVNVGDIKPAEYLTQYFMDAAFDTGVLDQDPQRHLEAWASAQFGSRHALEISQIMWEYYRLSWERRPEFMGWSQIEPTRPVRTTAYMGDGGEEAEHRLAQYADIVRRAELLSQQLQESQRDAFYQLVLYPVRASSHLNHRVLKLDLAAEYAHQQRPSSNAYVEQAKQAHAALLADTASYNTLADGKWASMMGLGSPRYQPVMEEPLYPAWTTSARRGCDLVYPTPMSVDANSLGLRAGQASEHTLTLASYGGIQTDWSLAPDTAGFVLDQRGGQLNAANGFEQRIRLSYDGSPQPSLRFSCGERTLTVKLNVTRNSSPGPDVERYRVVMLPGGAGQLSADWETHPGLGAAQQAIRARLDLPSRDPKVVSKLVPVTYRFRSESVGGAVLRIVALPVHALTSANGVRLGVRIDGGPMTTLDFATVGRSDEWKENVLSNSAVRSIPIPTLKPGSHRIDVFALDPGVILDRLEVVLDGASRYYGIVPGKSRQSK